jgi:uncharacterized protein
VGALVVAAIFAIFVSFTSSAYHAPVEQPKEQMRLALPGQPDLRVNVRPLSEIKNDHFVKQQYDFSCGSAALAIVLNFYLGENFTEKQVIQGLLQYGDLEQIIKRKAFSLLDMKRFVSVIGYQGEGYRAELEDLKSLTTPCIVPIKVFDYRHFVVFKGIYKDHIFFTDPWWGDISYSLDEFYKERWYEKVIFIVSKQNGPVLSALQLKSQDLKFIDEDQQRTLLFDRLPDDITDVIHRRLVNTPVNGRPDHTYYQYFKP